MTMSEDEAINFDDVETFVGLAREAYEQSDLPRFVALRKLIVLSLGMGDTPPPRFNTKHLRKPVSEPASG